MNVTETGGFDFHLLIPVGIVRRCNLLHWFFILGGVCLLNLVELSL